MFVLSSVKNGLKKLVLSAWGNHADETSDFIGPGKRHPVFDFDYNYVYSSFSLNYDMRFQLITRSTVLFSVYIHVHEGL